MTTKTCPDCGRPKRSHLAWINDFDSKCAAWTGATDARLACNVNTIARLRAELASARELNEAERAVVEAAINLRIVADKAGLHRLEASEEVMGTVDALLALRAKKAGT